MLAMIPTYVVSWSENDAPALAGDCRVRMRVPQNHLDALLHLLSFNNVAWFDVRREDVQRDELGPKTDPHHHEYVGGRCIHCGYSRVTPPLDREQA